MSQAGPVLYITHDGITDHIGQSQIAPYLIGLAQRGYRIHVLSAEKPGREAAIARAQRAFDAAGIGWTRIVYSSRFSFLSFVFEAMELQRVASRLIVERGIRVLHCRCFPGTLVGDRLARRFGLRLLFDFRDFWPDTRIETRRFTLPYRLIKRMEPGLVRRADRIVCLTHRARDVLIARHLADQRDAASRFEVIPCCADFDLFDVAAVNHEQLKAAREQAGLGEGGPVLLYLGSIGADYLLDEMLVLFRETLLLRPSARFLFVTNNGGDAVRERGRALGLPVDRIHLVSVERAQVPVFVALADFAVVFIRPSPGKAGCSPTKLAELFACGVPVIANSGFGDVDSIATPDRNGSVVVDDFAPGTLRQAVERVLALRQAGSVDIRANSAEFSLTRGVARYAAVYDALGVERTSGEAR